jgi:hypothetical protein
MSQRKVPTLGLLAALAAAPALLIAFATFMTLLSLPVAAQTSASSKGAWTPPRTPDGQPDLRGTWVNFDSTPFEAPIAAPAVPLAPAPAGGAGVGPPSHWADHDSPMKAARRSMVVDPPDGRVPVMTWAEDKRAYDLDHVADHWVHQTPWDRCITRGIPAGMFPAGYNNGYQFMQTPGYVVIVYEMIHVARVIPIDGRPHVGSNIRTWDGDPRGHWEGTTLVVDTTNYNDKGSIATSAATGRIRGIPQSEALHVVERFTPVDANTIQYRVTVDDKNVYTKPWTVEMPLTRDSKYQMFEYACQEGNYATGNILAGGRAEEKK